MKSLFSLKIKMHFRKLREDSERIVDAKIIIFTMKNIAASRLAESKPTYMAFLDFQKAFDTVCRMGYYTQHGTLELGEIFGNSLIICTQTSSLGSNLVILTQNTLR